MSGILIPLLFLLVAPDPPPVQELALRGFRLAAPALERLGGFVNTGLDIDPRPLVAAGARVAFQVQESEQGGLDLNGDGDALDEVVHLVDLRGPRVENLGLRASDAMLLTARELFLAVRENEVGADLNGDGDQSDTILHRHEVQAGSPTTALGLAGSFELLDARGPAIARVSESQQAVDLNGDGDARDYLPWILGPLAARPLGAPRSAPVALSLRPLPAVDQLPTVMKSTSAGITLLVSELSEGFRDRNGDGDRNDLVLAVVDPLTLAVSNLGLAAITDVRSDGARLIFRVSEVSQKEDLDGDGQEDDTVVHLYDGATGLVTNLGIPSLVAQVLGDWMSFVVPEAAQLQDLNQDGDTMDNVLFVQRVGDALATNLALAVTAASGGSGSRVLFTVNEHSQGMTDLNGDGDFADNILFSFDTTTRTFANLSVALLVSPEKGERLAPLLVDEYYDGADYNFDGDTLDIVLGIYDGELDTFLNTQLAVGTSPSSIPPLVLGDRLVASVIESASALDLNGDGDLFDVVVVSYEATSGTLASTGLAGEPYLVEGIVAVAVGEFAQGATDLNGDGDLMDEVVHALLLDD